MSARGRMSNRHEGDWQVMSQKPEEKLIAIHLLGCSAEECLHSELP